MRISDWSSDVCSSDLILIVVMKKPKLIFVLLGLMLMTVIGLGSFGASAMAAKTDHFGVSHTASAPQAAGAGADYLYAGDHHGASHDRRSLPGHHEGRHAGASGAAGGSTRSEEHTSELQSLMRHSYAIFCLQINNSHNSTEQ